MCAAYCTISSKFVFLLHCQHAVARWSDSVGLRLPVACASKLVDVNRRCRVPQSPVCLIPGLGVAVEGLCVACVVSKHMLATPEAHEAWLDNRDKC